MQVRRASRVGTTVMLVCAGNLVPVREPKPRNVIETGVALASLPASFLRLSRKMGTVACGALIGRQ